MSDYAFSANGLTLAGEQPDRRRKKTGEGDSLSLAAAITKGASQQTYYTIRFLVGRSLIPDAFRAYAYFR